MGMLLRLHTVDPTTMGILNDKEAPVIEQEQKEVAPLENKGGEPISVTRAEVMKMTSAKVKEMAESLGIDGANLSGTKLKMAVIEKLGL